MSGAAPAGGAGCLRSSLVEYAVKTPLDLGAAVSEWE